MPIYNKNMGDESRPVFVLGMPRSGTTLVGTMLSSHPSLAVAPETHFLNQGMDLNIKLDVSCPKNFEKFWANYSQIDHFKSLDMNADKIKEHILKANRINFKTIYTEIMEEFGRKNCKPRWGDKSHLDYPYVDLLLEWFPNSNVILVLRDPRGVVASLQKIPWEIEYIYISAVKWREGYYILKRYVDHERVYIVKYEELVQNPIAELKSLCKFLDEEYDSAMISRDKDPTPTKKVKKWTYDQWWNQHRKKTLKPVNSESLYKWRSELTSYQVAVIEHITRAEMLECGYEPETSKLGVKYAIYLILDIVKRNLGRAKRGMHHPTKIWRIFRSPKGKRLKNSGLIGIF